MENKTIKNNCLVIKVHDGDTITVESEQKHLVVRLNGIDAPEISQRFGKESQKFLSDLVLNKIVSVQTLGKDVYSRSIGKVTLNDIDINAKMVECGYSWWNNQYCPKEKSLHILETSARASKLGLWSDTETPIPPWRWRKMLKIQELQEALKKPEKPRAIYRELVTDEDLEI